MDSALFLSLAGIPHTGPGDAVRIRQATIPLCRTWWGRMICMATVTFDTTKTDIAAIHASIEHSGYKATREVPK